MKVYRLLICLLVLITISTTNAQNDSANYQNFPKEQLQTIELQQIARILPQAESYYHQNKIKDQINAEQKHVIDTLLTAFEKTEEREKKYIEQLALKDDEIELVRPKWWQEPVIIIGEVILALILGIMIAK